MIDRLEQPIVAPVVGGTPELEAFLAKWTHLSRLQTFEDRERFRAEAAALVPRPEPPREHECLNPDYCGTGDRETLCDNARPEPREPEPPLRGQLVKWAAELVRAVCCVELAHDVDRDVAEPVRRIALQMRDAVDAAVLPASAPSYPELDDADFDAICTQIRELRYRSERKTRMITWLTTMRAIQTSKATASAPSRPLEELVVEWREQIAELKQLLDARDPDAYIYARRRSECDTLEMCVAELERLRVLGSDPNK